MLVNLGKLCALELQIRKLPQLIASEIDYLFRMKTKTTSGIFSHSHKQINVLHFYYLVVSFW